MGHARSLRKQPLEVYPKWSYFFENFHEEQIPKLLNHLTPSKCQIYLIAKEEDANFVANKSEKWMGVKYRVQPFSTEEQNNWEKVKPNPSIFYPPHNPYIPETLQLVEGISKMIFFVFFFGLFVYLVVCFF